MWEGPQCPDPPACLLVPKLGLGTPTLLNLRFPSEPLPPYLFALRYFDVRRSAFGVRCSVFVFPAPPFPRFNSPSPQLSTNPPTDGFAVANNPQLFWPRQNLLPPLLPVYYHRRIAIRAKQTPNRPRAAACPDSVRQTPVLKANTLLALEEPPPCTTPAVMPATLVHRLSRDRLKHIRL